MQHLAIAVGIHAGSVHRDADGHERLDFLTLVEEGNVHGLDLGDLAVDRIGDRVEDRFDLDFGKFHFRSVGECACGCFDRDGDPADDVAELGLRIGDLGLFFRSGFRFCSRFCSRCFCFGRNCRLFGFLCRFSGLFGFFCGLRGLFVLCILCRLRIETLYEFLNDRTGRFFLRFCGSFFCGIFFSGFFRRGFFGDRFIRRFCLCFCFSRGCFFRRFFFLFCRFFDGLFFRRFRFSGRFSGLFSLFLHRFCFFSRFLRHFFRKCFGLVRFGFCRLFRACDRFRLLFRCGDLFLSGRSLDQFLLGFGQIFIRINGPSACSRNGEQHREYQDESQYASPTGGSIQLSHTAFLSL